MNAGVQNIAQQAPTVHGRGVINRFGRNVPVAQNVPTNEESEEEKEDADNDNTILGDRTKKQVQKEAKKQEKKERSEV